MPLLQRPARACGNRFQPRPAKSVVGKDAVQVGSPNLAVAADGPIAIGGRLSASLHDFQPRLVAGRVPHVNFVSLNRLAGKSAEPARSAEQSGFYLMGGLFAGRTPFRPAAAPVPQISAASRLDAVRIGDPPPQHLIATANAHDRCAALGQPPNRVGPGLATPATRDRRSCSWCPAE